VALDDNAGALYTFTTKTVDVNPPTIPTSTGNTAGTTGEPVTIIATMMDDVGVTGAELHYTPIGGTETTIQMARAGSGDSWSADMPVAINRVGVISYYLIAEDAGGNSVTDPATGTYGVIVTDNDAPIAEAGDNKTGKVGEVVNFDGSVSTDNIGVTSSTWDFDTSDGIQVDASGVMASHVYEAAGSYMVTLTATDAAGNFEHDTLVVTVTNPSIIPTANINIVLSRESTSRTRSRDTVVVTVLVDSLPLSGAAVYGTWSGAYVSRVRGTTSTDGKVRFRTPWVSRTELYTFTVTSVQKNGVRYILAGTTSKSN
jgi:PKD repeat protein